MLSDQSFINEVKNIILQSRGNAVRSVNWERTIMYWKIGKRIFEEEQEGKDTDSFTDYFQLRPHCGRNSIGRIISLLYQLMTSISANITLLNHQTITGHQDNWSVR